MTPANDNRKLSRWNADQILAAFFAVILTLISVGIVAEVVFQGARYYERHGAAQEARL